MPVSGTDAAGASFKPKRGKQLEAGVKWQAPEGRTTASAAVYRLREKNRLAADPDNVGFSIQRGEVTVDGVELEGWHAGAGRLGLASPPPAPAPHGRWRRPLRRRARTGRRPRRAASSSRPSRA